MTALVASDMAFRRLWLPFVLVIAITLWYRQSQPKPKSPNWNVVNFQIKDYQSKEEAYAHKAGSFQDQQRPYRLDQNYQAEIEAIRNRPAFQQQQLSYDELQGRIQQFIQWDRPYTDHWPAWHDYDNADYDPNRWEGMDRYEDQDRIQTLLLT